MRYLGSRRVADSVAYTSSISDSPDPVILCSGIMVSCSVDGSARRVNVVDAFVASTLVCGGLPGRLGNYLERGSNDRPGARRICSTSTSARA